MSRVAALPPAPMNHVKIFSLAPPRCPCGAGTTVVPNISVWQISVSRKWKPQLDWVMKLVPHDLMRRIRFWRKQSPEQDFKYLYWTISKILSSNLTCVREHKWLIGSGGQPPRRGNLHTRTRTHTHANAHTHTHTHTHMAQADVWYNAFATYTRIDTHTHTRAHAHTCAHTRTHTHTHTHTHVHTRRRQISGMGWLQSVGSIKS